MRVSEIRVNQIRVNQGLGVDIYIQGFMSNLIKKSWTDSNFSSVVRKKWKFWRHNLPVCRCPGRQVWRTLQIEDCRHITTVEAMFEQICKHIKQSTNNGIIIPTISIFPSRKVDKDHLGKQLLFSYVRSLCLTLISIVEFQKWL